MYQSLTVGSLRLAVKQLCKQDSLLDSLVAEFGYPPLWQRSQSFDTLVHIIMEQKVSLASAKAVMGRVRDCCPSMTADDFLCVSESALREAGVSGRKVSYCRSIAESLSSGQLSLAGLRRMSNEKVIDELTSVRGIGPWTAGVYLLMAMRRADAWASGDRALVLSYAQSMKQTDIPSYPMLDEIALRWQPYRGAASRILWHSYLCRLKK